MGSANKRPSVKETGLHLHSACSPVHSPHPAQLTVRPLPSTKDEIDRD